MPDHKAQTVGAVLLPNDTILLAIGDNGTVYFYNVKMSLEGASLRYHHQLLGTGSLIGQPSYQSTNFLQECGTQQVYLLGLANAGAFQCPGDGVFGGGKIGGDDPTLADLYAVHIADDSTAVTLERVARREFGKYNGAACAGTGIYVNTQGQLSIYLMEHDGRRKRKSGPFKEESRFRKFNKRGVVQFYEFSAP
jgi:hypothetical protein